MTEMLMAGSLLVLALGGWVIWLGMARPSWSEFWDRPVCWLVGHNLTNALFDTTCPVGETTYPAAVWRCSRHASLVTVVGPSTTPWAP